MKTIQDGYLDFRYLIDDAPDISPTLGDVQLPDLSAVVFKGTFTIREVLTTVLSAVKVVDTRNNPTGKPVRPAFIITDNSIFISTPARCRERKGWPRAP